MEDRSRRRARLFTIVGVVLAAAAGIFTFVYVNSAGSAAPAAEEKGSVVVAARDLAARQSISASDVTIAQYPKSLIPPSAATDAREVTGKVLTVAVAKNETISQAKFATQQGKAAFTVVPPGTALTPDGALPPGTPNYRAMSITVPDANAVAGNLVAGDLVDLLVTVNIDTAKFGLPAPPSPPDPNRVPDFSSKVILENVPILDRTASVYTIRVADLGLAERIAYLQSSGATLTLLLRAPKDERKVETGGTNFEGVFKEFRFPTAKRFAFP